MNIIITGFMPFNKEISNPSYEAVKILEDEILAANIIKIELPVVFEEASKILNAEIDKYQPHAVICVGQAGGRTTLSIERVAINLKDAPISDNAGVRPCDEKIKEDGENAYFSTLPVKQITSYLRENGVPCAVSYTAGTYVCNEIMYQTLYHIDKSGYDTKAGFIHVPFSCEQVAKNATSQPSMEILTIAKGLKLAITALINGEDSNSTSGGYIS